MQYSHHLTFFKNTPYYSFICILKAVILKSDWHSNLRLELYQFSHEKGIWFINPTLKLPLISKQWRLFYGNCLWKPTLYHPLTLICTLQYDQNTRQDMIYLSVFLYTKRTKQKTSRCFPNGTPTLHPGFFTPLTFIW